MQINRNIISIICLFILFILAGKVEGQSTYNPLSIYGIGEPDLNEYGSTSGMGGVSIGIRGPEFLNSSNPASLTAIDTNTFIYNMAVGGKWSMFKSGDQRENTANANIKKIALGFVPAKKWALSAGMQPFSATGYKILTTQNVEGTGGTEIPVKYVGNGGLNKLYLSNAFTLFRGLSIGVNTYCILGSITTTEETEGWTIERTSSTSKVSWDFGMQYMHKTKNNVSYVFGATYGLSNLIHLNNTIKVTDANYNTLKEGNTDAEKQELPPYYGFGTSFNFKEKLIIASDYSFYQWSTVKSNFDNVNFTDVHKVRLGVEYTPNRNVYANLIQRLQYQGGVSIGNSYLRFGDKDYLNYAFSLGIGIPVKASLTAHISYERGNSGLSGSFGNVKENYNLFSVSFSIKDIWFLKRKYD